MFDRLGQLALLSERHAPVVVGAGVVGLDAQGLLEMFDRLGQLAPMNQLASEVVLSDYRVVASRKGMGPEPLRVMPDLGLAPGEDSQRDDDTCGNAGERENCRWPCLGPAQGLPAGPEAGACQGRPSEAGQVGVAIRGNLRADL